MEVHHHSHGSHGGPKKFRQYFWEFFMLFLAVTAGFFVENQREHMVENRREKQFVISFTRDLRKDIEQLEGLLQRRRLREKQIDSLNFMLRSPDPDVYGNQIYFFSRYLPRSFQFINNNGTLQQLKNAGNLRLIRNQLAADTIMAYEMQQRLLEAISIRELYLLERTFNSLNKLCDPAVFDEMNVYDVEFMRPSGNPKLLTKDKLVIREYLSDIHYLRTVNKGEIGRFELLKDQAETTLSFLKKEYELE